MPARIYLVGRRIGRLIAIEELQVEHRHPRRFICVCDCGRYKEVSYTCLTAGQTRSCGCLRSELALAKSPLGAAASRTHGMTDTLTYKRWRSIIDRCFYPSSKAFERYG